MLNRKIYQKLNSWKKSKKKKCLILQGARQVGKTFAIKHFGSSNYTEVIELNFKETPSLSEIFSGDLDADTLITALRFRYPEYKISPDETLIFLDEIQECPEAITALKFLTADNRYDVIASGSLLGIDYKRASSYPVGYVEHMTLYALDFEEFLQGLGITDEMISSLRNHFNERTVVPDAINTQLMRYFRQYISIGGMPEAVQKYVDTHDFREVDRVQRDLLQGYLYDIAHYAKADEKVKAEKCYLSLSKQLLDKENHKFQYKEVEHGGRAYKYFSSIEWLIRADIVNNCHLVTDIKYDLNDYSRDDFFRTYTTDLSLLSAMKDLSLKQHIIENTLEGNTRGGIYECAIADTLYKNGYQLFYYKNDSTKKEIDFLIQKEGNVIPIEVKSRNSRATSLNTSLLEKKDVPFAYKLIDGNIGVSENGVITLPLYMAMFI